MPDGFYRMVLSEGSDTMHEKKMSLFSATLLNVNLMIGAGILIGPQVMAQKAGAASFIGWPIVALIFLPIMISIAGMALSLPGSGNVYSFARAGLGETAGFISSWSYFIGFNAVSACQILGIFSILTSMPSFVWLKAYALPFFIIYNIAINVLIMGPLRFIELLQNSATLLKLIPLVAVIVLAPFSWNQSLTFTSHEISNLPQAVAIAIFGFLGFEGCANIGHLVEGGATTVARAMYRGFILTGVVYTLFHVGLLAIMGSTNLAELGSTGFVSFLSFDNPLLKTGLSVLIGSAALVALVSCNFAVALGNSSLMQSMTGNRLFAGSHFLSPVNAFGRPYLAIVVHAIMSIFFILAINDIGITGAIGSLGVLTGYTLSLISLVVLHTKGNPTLFERLMAFAALGCISLLVLSCWISLGSSTVERAFFIAPLIIATAFGFILYKNK